MDHAPARRIKTHHPSQPNKKITNEKRQEIALKNVEDCLVSASFFDSDIVLSQYEYSNKKYY